MAELLLEILSEEIPAGMQAPAAAELAARLEKALAEGGIRGRLAHRHATPRRLVVAFEDLPLVSADRTIERRGPRVDAPEKAREGFLKGLGEIAYELGEIEDKKGRFLVASFVEPGRRAAEIVAGALPSILQSFPWPKSMRWGEGEAHWVRPLHAILCLLDGEVVPFSFAGIESGRETFGHRFMAPGAILVRDLEDYRNQLVLGRVMLDAADRRRVIEAKAQDLAKAAGFGVRPDPGLLDEIAGLVEWPVPLIGRIDREFMALPAEVLVTTMRANQKYLALEDGEGRLAPLFVTVANIEAPDGGAAIVAGNERVLRARLWDARFFWEQDIGTKLEALLPKLGAMVFHAALGSLGDKRIRLRHLAPSIATAVGEDPELAWQCAELCKADLVSGMVGEFPELQGIMGGYYARLQGKPESVASAITDHYRPLGPSDSCPRTPLGNVLSLADKLDTLVGFFSIGQVPTGSKDPFALRRAALGIIRIIIERGMRIDLDGAIKDAQNASGYRERFTEEVRQRVRRELLEFLVERLKVQQRENGVPHDLIAAVFGDRRSTDLVDLLARVEALRIFLASSDGADLLAALRRAGNIVQIEEKRDGQRFTGPVDPALLEEAAEVRLHEELLAARGSIRTALAAEDYAAAMATLARLRPFVDAFFDRVMVNAGEPAVRANRLRLLNMLRDDLGAIADFSVIGEAAPG